MLAVTRSTAPKASYRCSVNASGRRLLLREQQRGHLDSNAPCSSRLRNRAYRLDHRLARRPRAFSSSSARARASRRATARRDRRARRRARARTSPCRREREDTASEATSLPFLDRLSRVVERRRRGASVASIVVFMKPHMRAYKKKTHRDGGDPDRQTALDAALDARDRRRRRDETRLCRAKSLAFASRRRARDARDGDDRSDWLGCIGIGHERDQRDVGASAG